MAWHGRSKKGFKLATRNSIHYKLQLKCDFCWRLLPVGRAAWSLPLGFATALIGMVAWAASDVQYPLDPVAPQSKEECYDLYNRYMSVRQQFVEAARAKGAEANANMLHHSIAAPLYKEASDLYDRAFRILMDASAARLRCMQQVQLYESTKRAEQNASNSVPTDQAKLWRAKTERASFLARFEFYNGTTNASVLKTALRFADLNGQIEELRGGNALDRLSGALGIGTYDLDKIPGWDTLRAFMVSASFAGILDIHKNAVATLNSELQDFDLVQIQDQAAGLPKLLKQAGDDDDALIVGSAPKDVREIVVSDDAAAMLAGLAAPMAKMKSTRDDASIEATRKASERASAKASTKPVSTKAERSQPRRSQTRRITEDMISDCSYPSQSSCYRRECQPNGMLLTGPDYEFYVSCAISCARRELSAEMRACMGF